MSLAHPPRPAPPLATKSVTQAGDVVWAVDHEEDRNGDGQTEP